MKPLLNTELLGDMLQSNNAELFIVFGGCVLCDDDYVFVFTAIDNLPALCDHNADSDPGLASGVFAHLSLC